jgi:hypothetical protein
VINDTNTVCVIFVRNGSVRFSFDLLKFLSFTDIIPVQCSIKEVKNK